MSKDTRRIENKAEIIECITSIIRILRAHNQNNLKYRLLRLNDDNTSFAVVGTETNLTRFRVRYK